MPQNNEQKSSSHLGAVKVGMWAALIAIITSAIRGIAFGAEMK